MARPAGVDLSLRRAIEAHGRDAVAFQGLEPGMHAWHDDDGDGDGDGDGDHDDAAGAEVAYADTGIAWVAAGGPHAPPADRSATAARA